MTMKAQNLYAAALALAFGEGVHLSSEYSGPPSGVELIVRWSTPRLEAEYNLIKKKESTLSRMERDAVVREYERRTRE